MTLIVVKDGVMAADSIRTYVKRDSNRRKLSSRLLVNNAQKIQVYIGRGGSALQFQEETVIAVARYGNLRNTQDLVTALEHGGNFEQVLDRWCEHYAKDTRKGTLVVLTRQGVWKVEASTDTGVSITALGNEPFCLGVNQRRAMIYLTDFNLNAYEACAMAMVGEYSQDTPGWIRYIKRPKQDTSSPRLREYEVTPQSIYTTVALKAEAIAAQQVPS